MLYMTREERLLPLEGMVNTRDLGGYETQSGAYSRSHKYIRASSPTHATKKDIQYLKDYGIKVVIDLNRKNNRILLKMILILTFIKSISLHQKKQSLCLMKSESIIILVVSIFIC